MDIKTLHVWVEGGQGHVLNYYSRPWKKGTVENQKEGSHI